MWGILLLISLFWAMVWITPSIICSLRKHPSSGTGAGSSVFVPFCQIDNKPEYVDKVTPFARDGADDYESSDDYGVSLSEVVEIDKITDSRLISVEDENTSFEFQNATITKVVPAIKSTDEVIQVMTENEDTTDIDKKNTRTVDSATENSMNIATSRSVDISTFSSVSTMPHSSTDSFNIRTTPTGFQSTANHSPVTSVNIPTADSSQTLSDSSTEMTHTSTSVTISKLSKSNENENFLTTVPLATQVGKLSTRNTTTSESLPLSSSYKTTSKKQISVSPRYVTSSKSVHATTSIANTVVPSYSTITPCTKSIKSTTARHWPRSSKAATTSNYLQSSGTSKRNEISSSFKSTSTTPQQQPTLNISNILLTSTNSNTPIVRQTSTNTPIARITNSKRPIVPRETIKIPLYKLSNSADDVYHGFIRINSHFNSLPFIPDTTHSEILINQNCNQSTTCHFPLPHIKNITLPVSLEIPRILHVELLAYPANLNSTLQNSTALQNTILQIGIAPSQATSTKNSFTNEIFSVHPLTTHQFSIDIENRTVAGLYFGYPKHRNYCFLSAIQYIPQAAPNHWSVLITSIQLSNQEIIDRSTQSTAHFTSAVAQILGPRKEIQRIAEIVGAYFVNDKMMLKECSHAAYFPFPVITFGNGVELLVNSTRLLAGCRVLLAASGRNVPVGDWRTDWYFGVPFLESVFTLYDGKNKRIGLASYT